MKKNSKGVIYTITHKESGKVYVGATTTSIERRIQDHKQRASKGSHLPLHKAIATYGIDAFDWHQTDTAENSNELAQKEKETISIVNAKEDGYNLDSGGGFQKYVYQYNVEDGKLLKRYNSLEDAANAVNAIKQQISRACLSVNNLFEGFYWSYEYNEPFITKKDKRLKKVIQYDLNLKELNRFDSVAIASRKTGVFKSSIAKVCRGERNTAGGYIFKYI